MRAYENFSAIYDQLMEDVDYSKWCDFLEQCFGRMNVSPHLILELGCGTGNVTVPMAKRGYSMIGLDCSADMLTLATEKSQGLDILYLLQDMTDFELYGTVDAVICTLDGLNYLTEAGALEQCFSLVSLFLNPGGVFLFDLNTQYKMEQVLAPETFVYEDDLVFYTWQSNWDGVEGVCEYDLTFFVREGELYRRFEETHVQKAYSTQQVIKGLNSCGMELFGAFDGISFLSAQSNSERIFYAAQKPIR